MKKLFFRAYLQVGLVAVSTYLISVKAYALLWPVSFFISFLWTFNVGKVATSGMKSKIVYSCGAAFGTLSGVFISDFLYNF